MKTAAITTIVIALAVTILQIAIGAFPVAMFAFPLNTLAMLLWVVAMLHIYRNRTTSAIAKFMLSREATWLSLLIMAATGVVLGLQRNPMSDAWAVVIGLLFVQSHLMFVVLRGWRTNNNIRWRFAILHIGLLLALGAGFWGAPDREQLRISVGDQYSNEAYSINGAPHRLPSDIRLEKFDLELSPNGTPTNYEAVVNVDGRSVSLRVNHPYNRTLSEKIYLVSYGNTPMGSRYVILEIVNEPWQWLSATGIVMLICGAVLLFIRGPQRKNSIK
jgi:hypothetical protein